jgi:hypothetical protein
MIRYNLSSPRTKFEMLLDDARVRNAARSLERIWQISDIGPLSARHVFRPIVREIWTCRNLKGNWTSARRFGKGNNGPRRNISGDSRY